ncbi:MAG: cytidine deaminase [Novosphingobium sp. 17-62-19]|uniref:cytidine deaminase n=1 Tax=Novosphingobium sp. 17-62-19 TaxID=1970406 RepID=UPI000BC8ECAA|nr:cytidine deaminase [Novosphingobium sp. 17-62-19]OYX92789.1 MAG: cytidine deaminase [Novosphingobium sp. 35-62-5]OZA19517.1 MAG: cytidine deaminase [Novosphingobium sp. 17-62-19]OZA71928.1 MAG: cytidine deaminase [Sphingomonadales bacterium 39-62-4]HQS97657.1 cytidine deaminase [Novosphingobium sp.]
MSDALIAEKRDELIAAARGAMGSAYAPYSGFHVGAALLFDDGAIVTGANFENASYGLSLCAETVACASASQAGRRGGLLAVAVMGGMGGAVEAAISPCGRCRQVVNELAALGGTDPLVLCVGTQETVEMRLSVLLPNAFGPANLA